MQGAQTRSAPCPRRSHAPDHARGRIRRWREACARCASGSNAPPAGYGEASWPLGADTVGPHLARPTHTTQGGLPVPPHRVAGGCACPCGTNVYRSRKRSRLWLRPSPASSASASLGGLTSPQRAFSVSPELGATGSLNCLCEMLQVDRRVEIAVDHEPTCLACEDALRKGQLRLHGAAA